MNFLRLPAVRALLGNIAETTLRDHIREGLFPPPVRHRGVSFWVATEVERTQMAIVLGYSDKDLKALVQKLIADRPRLFVKLGDSHD